MEEVNLFCNECGGKFSPDEIIFEDNHGAFYCEACFHERVIDNHWYENVSMHDIIDLLNQADNNRLNSFYISFVGGKNPYTVSKETYPSVFSVLSNRNELVRIIKSRTE